MALSHLHMGPDFEATTAHTFCEALRFVCTTCVEFTAQARPKRHEEAETHQHTMCLECRKAKPCSRGTQICACPLISFSRRRGPSTSSQYSNGWVDEGSSSTGGEEGTDGNKEHMTGVEAALAQGMASSLRTLVIASFRAPPNKYVLGEISCSDEGARDVAASRISSLPKSSPWSRLRHSIVLGGNKKNVRRILKHKNAVNKQGYRPKRVSCMVAEIETKQEINTRNS